MVACKTISVIFLIYFQKPDGNVKIFCVLLEGSTIGMEVGLCFTLGSSGLLAHIWLDWIPEMFNILLDIVYITLSYKNVSKQMSPRDI